jgi:hypothetical protein
MLAALGGYLNKAALSFFPPLGKDGQGVALRPLISGQKKVYIIRPFSQGFLLFQVMKGARYEPDIHRLAQHVSD